LVLLHCVSLAGEILIKLDTSDPNKEFSRHGLGKLSSLLHSREHSDIQKHQNSGNKILQSAQQKVTVTKDAENVSNKIVPMEQVRCLWLSATVTSHYVILMCLVSKCVPVLDESLFYHSLGIT
jgi:hypothetical protein